MGKLALSLDTMRLKWGIKAAPRRSVKEEKEASFSREALSSATINQLKKRRPKKRRR